MYGMKGKIDASVHLSVTKDEASMKRIKDPIRRSNGRMEKEQEEKEGERQAMVVPLELKTGKSHLSHRAQVLLYKLLLSDRYADANAPVLGKYESNKPNSPTHGQPGL